MRVAPEFRLELTKLIERYMTEREGLRADLEEFAEARTDHDEDAKDSLVFWGQDVFDTVYENTISPIMATVISRCLEDMLASGLIRVAIDNPTRLWWAGGEDELYEFVTSQVTSPADTLSSSGVDVGE